MEKHRITITYEMTTPESAEQGDFADTGWEDEEGQDMEPDEYDLEDGLTAVDKAITFLSGYCLYLAGDWYTEADGTEDYRTGSNLRLSFHLEGFTPQEEAAVYTGLKAHDKTL